MTPLLESRARAPRGALLGRFPALGLALAVSCGASTTEPVAPAPPAQEALAPTPEPPAPSITLVPQHAVRSADAVAWDPITGTLVVISGSGHAVLVDGATGLVRAVDRFARRAAEPLLVVGAGLGFVAYQSSEGEYLGGDIDLGSGTVSDSADVAGVASRDASTIVTWPEYDVAEVHVARVERGELGSCSTRPPEGAPLRASLSADGKLLLLHTDTRYAIIDTRDCSEQDAFERAPGPQRAAVSHEGRIALLEDDHVILLGARHEDLLRIVLGGSSSDIRFTADGRTIVAIVEERRVAFDVETGAPTMLDAASLAAVFTAPGGPAVDLDYDGGERAIHTVAIRPDAEGIVIGQRSGSVVVTREGTEVLRCLDGEQELSWSPFEPGVALQGEDGYCNVGTNEGVAPAAVDYGSYSSGGYDEYASGDEEPEPEDEVSCSPSDPTVCVTFPARGGPPRVTVGTGSRGHVVRGVGDARIDFSNSAHYLVLGAGLATRIVDVRTGRDRLRLPPSTIVDWGPEDHWVVTTATGGPSTFRSLEDVRLAFDVAPLASAESIVFEPGGTSALLCSTGGIERLSLTDGAISPLATQPCETIRVFGEHAVVHSPGDALAHVVALASGRVLLDFDGEAEPPPAGSPFFYRCEGTERILFDVAHATTSRVPGSCERAAVSADGRIWVTEQNFELVTLGRPDGAEVDIHVIWLGDTPYAYAEASDHAFSVAAPEDVALLNVVIRSGDAIRVASGADPEMQRRFYRPTLLADFLDERPLPVASP